MLEEEAVALLYDANAAESDLLALVCESALDLELREGALNHPHLSDGALDVLMNLRHAGVSREWILAFTDRPQLLTRFGTSTDPTERAAVAFNPSTPSNVLSALLADAEAEVRAAAVFHPAVPLEDIRSLAVYDPSEQVRENAQAVLSTSAGWSLRQGRRWVVASDS